MSEEAVTIPVALGNSKLKKLTSENLAGISNIWTHNRLSLAVGTQLMEKIKEYRCLAYLVNCKHIRSISIETKIGEKGIGKLSSIYIKS